MFYFAADSEAQRLLARLDASVDDYRAACFAESTKASYRSHKRAYLDFCVRLGCPPVPVTQDNLCRYAAYLADVKKLAAASIPKYLNAVRLLHLEEGLVNPLQHNWALDSILRGIKRCKGTTPNQKLPITPDILLNIHSQLNWDSPFDVVFWGACLVMFFGLFRKSNVLSPAGSFSPNKHLCRSDLIVHHWGLEVKVRWSKTIQNHERTLSVPIPLIPGHPLCPVTAVIKAFSLSPTAPPVGPAFVVPGLSQLMPLSYPQFVKHLRKLLTRLGLRAQLFAGHSFRRGGASFALQAGLPGDVIMQLGDWRSDAYKLYLDIPLSFKVRCMERLTKALPR